MHVFIRPKKTSTALHSIPRASYDSIMRLVDDFFSYAKIQAL
jgi:hypothetical protein